MNRQKLDLDRLEAASVADDGTRLSFRIMGTGGEVVEVGCGHTDLLPIIGFMVGLGGNAAAARAEVTPRSFGTSDKLGIEPIETSDIGLMRDMESAELVLVARMFGFDLSFTVTPHQLAALYHEIARALPKSVLVPSDHHHHHDHDHDHDH